MEQLIHECLVIKIDLDIYERVFNKMGQLISERRSCPSVRECAAVWWELLLMIKLDYFMEFFYGIYWKLKRLQLHHMF